MIRKPSPVVDSVQNACQTVALRFVSVPVENFTALADSDQIPATCSFPPLHRSTNPYFAGSEQGTRRLCVSANKWWLPSDFNTEVVMAVVLHKNNCTWFHQSYRGSANRRRGNRGRGNRRGGNRRRGNRRSLYWRSCSWSRRWFFFFFYVWSCIFTALLHQSLFIFNVYICLTVS